LKYGNTLGGMSVKTYITQYIIDMIELNIITIIIVETVKLNSFRLI